MSLSRLKRKHDSIEQKKTESEKEEAKNLIITRLKEMGINLDDEIPVVQKNKKNKIKNIQTTITINNEVFYLAPEKLGEGAQAKIKRIQSMTATHPLKTRIIAIPFYGEENIEQTIEDIFNEIKSLTILGRLRNWGVRISENQKAFKFYILNEFYPGETLDKKMNEPDPKKTFSLKQKIDFAKKLAEEMNLLHRAKIIHRDIKPKNIIVTTKNEDITDAKIVDFGLAASLGDKVELLLPNQGTPCFRPEKKQSKGRSFHDLASDGYQFGLILLLTFLPEHLQQKHAAIYNLLTSGNQNLPVTAATLFPLRTALINDFLEECGPHKNFIKKLFTDEFYFTKENTHELINRIQQLPLTILKNKINRLIGDDPKLSKLLNYHLAEATSAQAIITALDTTIKKAPRPPRSLFSPPINIALRKLQIGCYTFKNRLFRLQNDFKAEKSEIAKIEILGKIADDLHLALHAADDKKLSKFKYQ